MGRTMSGPWRKRERSECERRWQVHVATVVAERAEPSGVLPPPELGRGDFQRLEAAVGLGEQSRGPARTGKRQEERRFRQFGGNSARPPSGGAHSGKEQEAGLEKGRLAVGGGQMFLSPCH